MRILQGCVLEKAVGGLKYMGPIQVYGGNDGGIGGYDVMFLIVEVKIG